MSKVDEALSRITAARTEQAVGGVSATWLAAAFRMDRTAVIRRLVNCPTLPARGKSTQKLYDIATAARYLVPSAMTAEEFIRVASKVDLPPTLQAQFWDAMLKRQKYEEQAGALWPTSRIRTVLGDTFQAMKFSMQLWVDAMEREIEVTPRQREILVRMVDSLQKEIYDTLVKRASENETGPQIADLPALVGRAVDAETVSDEDEDDFAQI